MIKDTFSTSHSVDMVKMEHWLICAGLCALGFKHIVLSVIFVGVLFWLGCVLKAGESVRVVSLDVVWCFRESNHTRSRDTVYSICGFGVLTWAH